MKKVFYLILMPLLMSLASCATDIVGGTVNPTNKFDMTTFEYLQSVPELKVVATLFEKAGLKETINGEVTLIAPSKWSVNRYVRRRNLGFREGTAEKFTIENIEADEVAKMGMYIFPGKWGRDSIPEEGVYLTSVDGTQEVYLTLDPQNTDPGAAYDGGGAPGAGFQYSNFLQETPKLIHALFKRGENWELDYLTRQNLTLDNAECDQAYRMYISDVHTNNGVVHIVYYGDTSYNEHYYYHTLFFYGTRSDDK